MTLPAGTVKIAACRYTKIHFGRRPRCDHMPMGKFEARPGRAGDARAMEELFAWVAGERDGIATEPPVDLDERAARFARSADESIVAVAEGQIIGLIHVAVSRHGFGELAMLVERGWRGHGVGSALLAAAIDWAHDHGLPQPSPQVFTP